MSLTNGVLTVLPAPEGYEVDFENPRRIGVPEAYYIMGVTTFIGCAMMAQRLYTKFVLVGKVQWDDVFLILSWFISLSVVGMCTFMFVRGGGGVHGWEIDIPTYNVFMRGVYAASAIYIVGGSFAKISLLIFYFRLSPQKWFRRAVWATLAFITAYTVGIFFALIFACKPLAMSWDVTVQGGSCIDRPGLYIATAATNIASDVVLFCLPLPMVVRLQVPRRQKIGLVLIFFLGSLTLVTSIVRVTLLPEMLNSVDQTWVIAWATIWIIVEANLFIVCAALPTLRKFLKHFAPRLVGESYGAGTKGSAYATGTGGGASGLRTIGGGTGGSRSRRGEYARFDRDAGSSRRRRSESYDMQPLSEATFPSGVIATRAGASGWADGDGGGVWPDEGSDKAIVKKDGNMIVQTKTITVEYSNRV